MILVGIIDDLQQKVRIFDLFQRRVKCLYQIVWQLTDKSNGIGEEKFLFIWQMDAPDRRIQRGKQHIFCQHFFFILLLILFQKHVHERRLACVGITDQCDLRNTLNQTAFPLSLPILLHHLQLFFQFRNAMPDLSLVQFQLFLSGSPVGHAAAGSALTAQHLAHACQSWQFIL